MEEQILSADKFEYGKQYTLEQTKENILIIEQLPNELKQSANKLTPKQLEMSFRLNGWSAKQIIHHLADSHLNAYIRTKFTITENTPTIMPYNQDYWANLEDGANAPIEISIALIDALHRRWVYFLNSLTETDFNKTYIHPEYKRTFCLAEVVALYAWHGRHHCAQILLILTRGYDK